MSPRPSLAGGDHGTLPTARDNSLSLRYLRLVLGKPVDLNMSVLKNVLCAVLVLDQEQLRQRPKKGS